MSLLTGLVLGLKTLHQSGFAHLDVKPENVLLDVSEDGQLVAIISDFGIS